jgi:prepilin-type N-terminal cleavage/methylation domain-containing protein
MYKSYKRGFTLIELLVVIAIIGILASIVLASLDSARKKGRDARRIADLKEVQLALELYYDANGQYPAALTTATLVTPGYISIVPSDPSNQVVYAYEPWAASASPSVCSSYHLGADLEGSTNTALNGDADKTTLTIVGTETNPSGMVACTSATSPSAEFHGADSAKCQTGDVGVACYDVTP